MSNITVDKMRGSCFFSGWSLGYGFQEQLPNHLTVLFSQGMVLSGKEKLELTVVRQIHSGMGKEDERDEN